jgi:hypothetical protein
MPSGHYRPVGQECAKITVPRGRKLPSRGAGMRIFYRPVGQGFTVPRGSNAIQKRRDFKRFLTLKYLKQCSK